jgi:DNA-binding transcriptional MerR regulator
VIRIGDFARLGRVSVVTLRHYDEIGLLKPVRVDPSTGYRYYSPAQVSELNHILALKDLGFSLEQIERVLEGLTSDQLLGLLKSKHLEAQRQLADDQARARRIKDRLVQLKQEEDMPDYDVALKTAPYQLIASRSVTIPTNDQVPAYLDEAYGEVYSFITDGGAQDVGPCFSVWHQPAATLANEVVEAAVPVDRPLTGTDRVKVYGLPESQVASAVHRGELDSFAHLHATVLSWIETNNYQVVGPYREVYVRGAHEGDASSTEVQYPVAQAG